MKIKVFAPASIANICAGFDMLGVALESIGDCVTVTKTKEKKLTFRVDTNIDNIPTSENKNIAAYVAKLMMEELKIDFGIEMILHKNMPVGSGMGSSASSSVAAAVAVNALLPEPLSKNALLPFAMEGERKASGAAHADNVAPSLLGGACIIRNEKPLEVIQIPIQPKMTWIVLSPHLSISTSKARSLLPRTIPLSTATRQMGNLGGFVIGLMQGNAAIIEQCMVDHLAEPMRRSLIPAFSEIKKAALSAGALGCGISGSGPAIFALTMEEDKAPLIAHAMQAMMQEVANIESETFVSATNMIGAKIISESKA